MKIKTKEMNTTFFRYIVTDKILGTLTQDIFRDVLH